MMDIFMEDFWSQFNNISGIFGHISKTFLVALGSTSFSGKTQISIFRIVGTKFANYVRFGKRKA
jgi:hypothetical protein